MKLTDASESIVVYRCSPDHKSLTVNLVKSSMGKPITLAIGDGSNDVNMIQKAHIGIGIQGNEGNEAAIASDYSLLEFK